ncbi:MAG: glycosyltransferase family 39 protein [Planctomycetes bacterium]|nr:glycosyltransferase family 39 protein [Planctomycetota bacterium]
MSPVQTSASRFVIVLGSVALLAHALLVASLAAAVPFTTDEPGYLLAGHAIASDFTFSSPQERLHGPLAFLANQLFVSDFDPSNPDASRVAARLGTLPFSLAMLAIVWRWGHVLWGAIGGLLALFLTAFSPTLLAYSALATVDMAFVATALATLASLWAWCRNPTWPRAATTGVALGLCMSTKYLALLFAAALPLVLLWRIARAPRPKLGSVAIQVAMLALVAWVCLHATYGFRAGFFHDPEALRSGLIGGLARAPVLGLLLAALPAPMVVGADFQVAASTDFSGGFATMREAHWAYYLVAVSTKTTLPFLAAFVAGSVGAWRAHRAWLWPTIAIPVGILFGYLSVLSQLQIGIRYVLLVFPCMAILAGAVLRSGFASPRRLVLVGLGAAWVLAVLLAHWPHYLGYFNALVGGPAGAYRVFADSNAEWGQRRVEGEAELRAIHPDVTILRRTSSPRFGLVAVYVPDMRQPDPLRPDRLYHWTRRFVPIDHLGAAWLVFDIEADAFVEAANAGDRRAWHDLAIAFANAGDLEQARAAAARSESDELGEALGLLATIDSGESTAAQRTRAVQLLYALGATELALDVLRKSDDAEQTQLFLTLWSSGDPTRAVELLKRRSETVELPTRESLLLALGLFHLARFAEAVEVLDSMDPPPTGDPLRPMFDRFAEEARAKHAAMERLRQSGR